MAAVVLPPCTATVPDIVTARSLSLAKFDDGDHGTATVRPLMHGVNRDEHRRVTYCYRRHGPDGCLGVPMMVDVGVVEHDLTATAEYGAAICLTLDEAVDETTLKVLRSGPFREIEAGAADALVYSVYVQRILHDAVTDPKAAPGAGTIAEQDDLGLVELDP